MPDGQTILEVTDDSIESLLKYAKERVEKDPNLSYLIYDASTGEIEEMHESEEYLEFLEGEKS